MTVSEERSDEAPDARRPRAAPRIAAMAAYARADLSLPAGLRPVMLAQNESFLPPGAAAREAAAAAMAGAAFYSDADWDALPAAIAAVHGVPEARVVCGAGSMELIAGLAQAYLAPGDHAVTTAHGYLFFRTATALAGADLTLAPERDLTVDTGAVRDAVRPGTRVVWIANPGNPTGTRIDRAELVALREALPGDVLLVIDEAYGEFGARQGEQVFDLAERGDTVILRTFSKAYGLAGLRVGWGVFPEAVAGEMRKVLCPGGIAGPSLAAATAAMGEQAAMRAAVARTGAIRDAFAGRMRGLGLSVPESHTNFVLLGFSGPERAGAADRALRAEGVLLRGMGGYGLGQCLRATIGSEEDMALAGDVLARFAEREGV